MSSAYMLNVGLGASVGRQSQFHDGSTSLLRSEPLWPKRRALQLCWQCAWCGRQMPKVGHGMSLWQDAARCPIHWGAASTSPTCKPTNTAGRHTRTLATGSWPSSRTRRAKFLKPSRRTRPRGRVVANSVVVGVMILGPRKAATSLGVRTMLGQALMDGGCPFLTRQLASHRRLHPSHPSRPSRPSFSRLGHRREPGGSEVAECACLWHECWCHFDS